MRLTLPLPPSVNGATRNTSARERALMAACGRKVRSRVKSPAYLKWLDQADRHLLAQKQGLRRLDGELMVELRLPVGLRGDVSNRIKIAEDYLVSREITGDDKANWKVSAERDVSVEPGTVVIDIRKRAA